MQQGATMKRTILLFIPVFLPVVFFESLHALPRFAVRTGFKCQSCHVNPTGGGMRNVFGSTSYGREALPIKSWQEEFALEEFSTQLTDFLSYGLDFRFLYFYQKKDNPDAERSSFFPMQMDVYFNMKVSKKINVFVNPAFGPYPRYEIFGVANVLPLEGYLKLGRMTPSYGLRLDDHTAYVREATPFRNNMGQDVGVEISLSPGPVTVAAGLLNGSTTDRSSDRPRVVLSRAIAQFALGSLNAMIGGSTYNNASPDERINLIGGFAVLSWQANLMIIADIERLKGNWNQMKLNSVKQSSAPGASGAIFNSSEKDLEQLAFYLEANYLLIQGVDLKLAYDFFDPDTKLATGTASRYSFGFELFPISGVEVRPLYRYTKDTVSDLTTNEIHVLFHFYL